MRIRIAAAKRNTTSHDDLVGSTTAGAGRSCQHSTHVGTCAACQRAQLARWEAQLSHAAAMSQSRH